MSRLKQIRQRHNRFKKNVEPPLYWKSTLDISEVDYLFRKIDRLKAKIEALKS